MGNHMQQITNQNPKANKNEVLKKTLVQPYREGQVQAVQESTIKSLICNNQQKSDEYESPLIKFQNERDNFDNIQAEIKRVENENIDAQYIDKLREDFELNSKENKMGKKKFLQYFGMEQLDNCLLGNRLFNCAKSMLSKKKTGPYLDYSKFIKTISLLYGNNPENRLLFFYNLFDLNLDGKIEKEELKEMFRMFLESFNAVSFELEEMNEKRNFISKKQEKLIEQIIDELVTDIFKDHEEKNLKGQEMVNDKQQKVQILTFNSWKNWIQSLQGFNELLNFNPSKDQEEQEQQ